MANLKTSSKGRQTNYLGPFITMVFLFFVIGFLTTANTQFEGPLKATFLSEAGDLKNTLATLTTFSWFLAYPICGGLGAKFVNKYGYKNTLLIGLWIMFVGLGFYYLSSLVTVKAPEAFIMSVPVGFYIFLLGSFIVGSSVTILQVVINPYLSASEVKGTQSIQRLAIGGSANSLGTTLAPYFVTGVVFSGLSLDMIEIDQLMAPFFCLMVVVLIILLIINKINLPDIEGTRAEDKTVYTKSVWSFRHFTLGVVAIFFYVGVEVCVGANITMYAIEQNISSFALMSTIYWGLMLVGRLVGSSLRSVKPRVQLIFTTVCAAICVSIAMISKSIWLLALVGLFHSIMWGAIYTLATAHLGKYMSLASGSFMIGVVGGAILPLIQGVLADTMGGWGPSWIIVLAGEVIMLLYALFGSEVKQTAE